MSKVSQELYKTSNRIKLNKISQELDDIKNKTNAQHKKHKKHKKHNEVEQKILSKLEDILEKLTQIKKET